MAVDREAIKRMHHARPVDPGRHHGRARRARPRQGHRRGRRSSTSTAPKKLLADAGYPDGFEFTLDCPNNRYVNDEEICQALVGDVGARRRQGEAERGADGHLHREDPELRPSAYMLGWGVATFDALYSLRSLVRTKTTARTATSTWAAISDAKLDALIDAIKIETDVKKRDAMLREALILTRDQYYYVPLHHQLRPWAMRKGVEISL